MRLRLLSRRHPAAALLSLAAGLSVILFVTASGSAAVGQSRLLVKFRPGTTAGEHAAAIGAVGGTVEQAIPDIGVQVVSVPSTAAAECPRTSEGSSRVSSSPSRMRRRKRPTCPTTRASRSSGA